ncbi:thioredoxin-disulfide reductase [Myxococcota bacterium]|nr:thioredoxin-disulfide reductase [Myxococcota bacterium]MBU1432517.1 thioredoxin-disulfide reductase [Myxococcota bacterium]MBU1896812.1 thioredoxin-disulfide reductase [Myxococcota bacterium]
MSARHHKVYIIGSGPSGYTAGIYAGRANLSPYMAAGLQPGGQLTQTTDVENFPGYPEGIMGPEMMQQFEAQATRFGLEIAHKMVSEVDLTARPFKLVEDDGEAHTADAVIIATGATARYLGIPGEQEFLGRGVSACATCDGFFFRDQDVMVIGGGDSAMEEATFLTRFARKVYLVHRRDSFRASKVMQERALANEKIEVIWDSVATEVKGNFQGVNAVAIKNLKTGEAREVAVTGYFCAIGHTPNTSLFKGALDMDSVGYLQVKGRSTHTNIEGVFAAGDVADSTYRQAITAAGMGAAAAIDAERWLGEQGIE